MKRVGFILVYKDGPTKGEVVQSQGSAKLYLSVAAACGARTNMFGFTMDRTEGFYSLPLRERRAMRSEHAATRADIVSVSTG